MYHSGGRLDRETWEEWVEGIRHLNGPVTDTIAVMQYRPGTGTAASESGRFHLGFGVSSTCASRYLALSSYLQSRQTAAFRIDR